MNRYFRTLMLVLLVLTLSAGANAVALYSPGLNTIDVELTMPAGGYVSGFDILPTGDFLINDGHAIRAISRDGSTDTALYTYTTPVYGSFVRYNPANGKVYFGESSNGDIQSFLYSAPDDVTFVTNIANNFDMDFRSGQAYVVASDWVDSQVYLLGENSNDLIATCDGPSGPMSFDSDGNLIYIPATWYGPTEIIKWSSEAIDSAIGANALGRGDADLVKAVEAGYGCAFNSTGGLMFTNNGLSPKAIQIYKDGTVSPFATFVQPGASGQFISMVRQNPASGAISAVVSYTDANKTSHTVISSMAVPEPSSLLALCSLIGLAGSAKLLRGRRK